MLPILPNNKSGNYVTDAWILIHVFNYLLMWLLEYQKLKFSISNAELSIFLLNLIIILDDLSHPMVTLLTQMPHQKPHLPF